MLIQLLIKGNERGRKPMLWFPSQPERSEWFEDRMIYEWLGMGDMPKGISSNSNLGENHEYLKIGWG